MARTVALHKYSETSPEHWDCIKIERIHDYCLRAFRQVGTNLKLLSSIANFGYILNRNHLSAACLET